MAGIAQEQREAYPLIFGQPFPDSVPSVIALLHEQRATAEAWRETNNAFLYKNAEEPWLRWRRADSDDAIARHRHERGAAQGKLDALDLCIRLLESLEVR